MGPPSYIIHSYCKSVRLLAVVDAVKVSCIHDQVTSLIFLQYKTALQNIIKDSWVNSEALCSGVTEVGDVLGHRFLVQLLSLWKLPFNNLIVKPRSRIG